MDIYNIPCCRQWGQSFLLWMSVTLTELIYVTILLEVTLKWNHIYKNRRQASVWLLAGKHMYMPVFSLSWPHTEGVQSLEAITALIRLLYTVHQQKELAFLTDVLWNSMARVWGTIERAWIMCKVRKWGWGKKKGKEKWKFLEKWKSGNLKEFVMVRVSTIWQKDKNMNKNKRKNLILILTHRMMYIYITIYLQINRGVENVHMV